MPERVLFVDDDDALLRALVRRLRGRLAHCELLTAGSTLEAVAALERAPAAVVVSDVRMPGGGGIELLAEVRERWPDTVRIVLTGDVGPGGSSPFLGTAHRAFAKPCDSDLLGDAIAESITLTREPAMRSVLATVGGLARLPRRPDVWAQLALLASSHEVPVARVAALVESDVVLAADVLHLVNSAFFGLRHPISEVHQAVAYLGLGPLTAMVLAAEVRTAFAPSLPPELDGPAVHEYGLAVAVQARSLCPSHPGEAFTAALLQDFGLLLLGAAQPATCAAHLADAARGRALCEVERDDWEFDHGAAGAAILRLWGIAGPITEAVEHHHGSHAGGPVLGAVLRARTVVGPDPVGGDDG